MFSSNRQFFSSTFGRFGPSLEGKEDVLSTLLQGLKGLESKAMQVRAPEWLVQEVLGRGILLVNHVLLKEPQALDRLKRQKGRRIQLKWHQFMCTVKCTPAGLFELSHAMPLESTQAPAGAPGTESAKDGALPNAKEAQARAPDLSIELMESSVIALIQLFANGQKPPLHIQGDVQLAAEINWLVDHVRWDLEDDLARLVGDVNAHQLCKVASYVKESMVKFVALANQSFRRAKGEQHEGEGQAQ